MTVSATSTFPCPRCGNLLVYGQLACPHCQGLVYSRELTQLANDAHREEQAGNSVRAAMIWRQALGMLPPQSQQYQVITRHVGELTAQFAGRAIHSASDLERLSRDPAQAGRPVKRNDPWHIAVAKTAGSMIISIILYAMLFGSTRGWNFGLQFATGFVLLILVHELGHLIAMRYFGLSASPPIFIPFLGAVINLRQMPRNALEEAIVGIGGPVTGTLAAGVTYLLYLQTGSELLLRLAEFGFLLNLFNMLPVPPLDGGRITAAVSPWIWIPGLLYVVWWVFSDYSERGFINPILLLLLLMAWPRVLGVFRAQNRNQPYYRIGAKAQWGMGIAYALLAVALHFMFTIAEAEALRFGGTWFG